MRYDIDAEHGTIDFIDSQADTVDANRAFFGNVFSQVIGRFKFEAELTSVRLFFRHSTNTVDVTADDMPAQPCCRC